MEQILWCLWDGAEPTDYILNNGDIDTLPKLYNQDSIRFQYNQGNQNWSKLSCTLFSSIWMLADLMNKDFSLSDIKETNIEESKVKVGGQRVLLILLQNDGMEIIKKKSHIIV